MPDPTSGLEADFFFQEEVAWWSVPFKLFLCRRRRPSQSADGTGNLLPEKVEITAFSAPDRSLCRW